MRPSRVHTRTLHRRHRQLPAQATCRSLRIADIPEVCTSPPSYSARQRWEREGGFPALATIIFRALKELQRFQSAKKEAVVEGPPALQTSQIEAVCSTMKEPYSYASTRCAYSRTEVSCIGNFSSTCAIGIGLPCA